MTPHGEASARPACIAGEWFGRHGRRLVGAVGLSECDGADAGALEPITLGEQLSFGRDAAEHEMARVSSGILGKVDASLEGGVGGLHELLPERQILANQDVGIANLAGHHDFTLSGVLGRSSSTPAGTCAAILRMCVKN